MVPAAKTDIALPDGLDLVPVEPEFFNDIWPMTLLDSSMGSLLLVGTIYAVALIVCAVLFFIGRAFPRIRGFLFSGLFLIAGLFVGYAAFLAISNWNAPDSVSEASLAETNTRTENWLLANKVSATKAQVNDLVCDYYEAKSRFCTGKEPVVKIGGGERTVKMSKGQNGFMVLTDTKNQIPLVGEGAK